MAVAEGHSSVDEHVQTLLCQDRLKAAKQKLEDTLQRVMEELATEMTREYWNCLK